MNLYCIIIYIYIKPNQTYVIWFFKKNLFYMVKRKPYVIRFQKNKLILYGFLLIITQTLRTTICFLKKKIESKDFWEMTHYKLNLYYIYFLLTWTTTEKTDQLSPWTRINSTKITIPILPNSWVKFIQCFFFIGNFFQCYFSFFGEIRPRYV